MIIQLRKFVWVLVVLVLVAVLSGCSALQRVAPIGGSEAPEVVDEPATTEAPEAAPKSGGDEPELSLTQAAETIVAELTQNAPLPTATEVEPPAAPAPTDTPTQEALPPTSTPLPTNTPLPTDTPFPTNTPTPVDTATMTWTPTFTPFADAVYRLVFEDDFSADTFWIKQYTDEVEMHFGLGGYVMKNKVLSDIVWSVRSTPYANVRVEAIGHTLNGRRDDYYGVVCHFGNGSNYYAMLVGNDGSFGVARQLEGNLEFLHWELDTTGTVRTLGGENHIIADCLSTTLSLTVNGVKLMEIEDLTFSGGNVGFAVGTGKYPGHEVIFNYFAVSVMEQ